MRFRVCSFAAMFVLVGSVAFGESQRRTEIVQVVLEPFTEVVAECGDFQVLNSYGGVVRLVIRYDASGTEVQDIQHFLVTDSVYYNSTDPALSIEGRAEHVNGRLTDGIFYLAGPGYRVKVPGAGPILLWTGHWAFNTVTGEFEFFRGPAGISEEETAAICHALRPR
jgi:hypothetical protein